MGPWGDFPNVTAMIYAGAPGEQTGPAIVDVLYGAVNPSGRLPFTIAVVRSVLSCISPMVDLIIPL